MSAHGVPTPGGTPAGQNPYAPPESDGTRGLDGQEGDRSLGVCDMAYEALREEMLTDIARDLS